MSQRIRSSPGDGFLQELSDACREEDFRLDLARLPRAASGELPSAWRDDAPGKREARKNS